MKLADHIRKERQKTPAPGPSAIRAVLIAQGHSVSLSYIKLVIWRDRKPKKKAKKKPKRTRQQSTEYNSSQAIRALLYEDASMPTAKIQDCLAEQGKKASANLIKVVRHEWRQQARPQDYYGSDGRVLSLRERLKLDFVRDLQKGSNPMPVGGVNHAEFEAILKEARRELLGESVDGTPRKTEAEIDAEVEELLNRFGGV